MLGSQRDALVGVLFSELVRDQLQLVLLLSLLLNALGFRCQSVALVSGVQKLLAQGVDLGTMGLVLGLGLIQSEALILDLVLLMLEVEVLLAFNFVCRFLHCVGLLLFFQLLFDLLDLLVDGQQTVALVLESLRVCVDFTLQALGFGLVDSTQVLGIASAEGGP